MRGRRCRSGGRREGEEASRRGRGEEEAWSAGEKGVWSKKTVIFVFKVGRVGGGGGGWLWRGNGSGPAFVGVLVFVPDGGRRGGGREEVK